MIEYIDECHMYLADGIIIPSVSNLVSYATGDDYSKIPSCILKQAQDFGTDIHNAIEYYLKHNTEPKIEGEYKKQAFNEFKRIYLEYIDTSNCACEMIIDYNERYAGRFDCLSNGVLIDYKTNSKLNIPHLEWQMGLYKMALEERFTFKIEKCMCLWLPKGKSGKWIEIAPKTKEECLKLLEDYENDKRFDED